MSWNLVDGKGDKTMGNMWQTWVSLTEKHKGIYNAKERKKGERREEKKHQEEVVSNDHNEQMDNRTHELI